MNVNPASDSGKERGRPAQGETDEQYHQRVLNKPGIYSIPTGPVPQQTEIRRTFTTAPVEVNTTSAAISPLDRVRWGPVLAGLVSTLATLIVLSLLGIAVGLTAAAGDPNGGTTAAANNASNYGTGAAIWAGISALIAFFIGGLIAGRMAGIRGKLNGWVNGALVWAVVLPLLLWLAGSGAAGLLNGIGFNLNGFLNNLSSTVNNATSTAANNSGVVQSATETARNGAWGALIALLLGLIASGLGGLVGSRSYNDELTQNDGVLPATV